LSDTFVTVSERIHLANVAIDNLVAGMVLKSNVCDRSGRLLLPEGAELTEKHLQIFRTWGILEAEIVGDSDSEATGQDDEIDPEVLAEAEAAVKPLFVHNDLEHPAIKELLRLCIARKALHASR
jgi:hypothetical protein